MEQVEGLKGDRSSISKKHTLALGICIIGMAIALCYEKE